MSGPFDLLITPDNRHQNVTVLLNILVSMCFSVHDCKTISNNTLVSNYFCTSNSFSVVFFENLIRFFVNTGDSVKVLVWLIGADVDVSLCYCLYNLHSGFVSYDSSLFSCFTIKFASSCLTVLLILTL